MNKFFKLFVYNKNNPRAYYRNLILFLIAVVFLYIFFAIGDMVIKGQTDLTFTPVALMFIAIGVLIAAYLKAKK